MLTEDEKYLYNIIDKILDENDTKTVFGTGEETAKWSFYSTQSAQKFIYIDEYDTCDKFYNLIHKNQKANILTAVVYPFMQDNEIPTTYRYRGLYDYFAKQRYKANAIVILNTNEFYENAKFDTNEFCQNIIEFSEKIYIHKFDKIKEYDLAQYIKKEMINYFKDVELTEYDSSLILIAKNKITNLKDYSNYKQYENFNRGPEAKQHSEQLIKIIKQR